MQGSKSRISILRYIVCRICEFRSYLHEIGSRFRKVRLPSQGVTSGDRGPEVERRVKAEICLTDHVPGCKNFYWHEVLYCTQWECHVFPTGRQYENLIKVSLVLQEIRNRLNRPIRVTSGLRAKKYNELIHGAKASMHIWGKALDFQVKDIDADQVRNLVFPWLDELKIRMENLNGSSWVHIDIREPTQGRRYFLP